MIKCVLFLSLSFATATGAFSQLGESLKIQKRNSINCPSLQENHIGNKQHRNYLSNTRRSQRTVIPINDSENRLKRSTSTTLRGGFFLPISNIHPIISNNPFWNTIGIYAISDFVIGFFVSICTGSHLHLDLVGTGAFAIAALPYTRSSVAHIRWSSIAVCLWATKLALFLFYRALQVNTDNRLTDLLTSTQGSFQFWLITFLWNIVASLPYILGLLTSNRGDNRLALFTGGAIYLAGLAIETIADAQKWFFKQDQSKVGQFCNIGLWRYSQHPNWFGNLLLWGGILIINLPSLIEPLPDNNEAASLFLRLWGVLWSVRKLLLACLGPSFLWLLFDGQSKGNITNAVELATVKYGKNPDYLKYTQEVPLIIPKNIFRKFW